MHLGIIIIALIAAAIVWPGAGFGKVLKFIFVFLALILGLALLINAPFIYVLLSHSG